MKAVYPVILSKGKKYIIAHVPDFTISTQGKDEADAMEMARDAIGLTGIDMEDENEKLPEPSKIKDIKKEKGSPYSLMYAFNNG